MVRNAPLGRMFVYLCGLVLVLSLLQRSVRSDDRRAGEHKIISIQLGNYHEDLRYLVESGYDIAGVDFHEKIVDVIADHEEVIGLKMRFGASMKVTAVVGMSTKPDDGYLVYDEVVERMKEIAEQYPSIVHLEEVGRSIEDRAIVAVKISDNAEISELEEPTVFFNAMHHAREVMTTEVAVDTIEQLVAGYGSDANITRWVDEQEIWVLPMLNPDGNHKVWHADSMWRKNVRNGHGVDLNRNYPEGWNGCQGSSGSTGADDYRGSSPGSEPETQTLMRLVERIRPVMSISYHSYSEMVLFPSGCRPKRTMASEQVEAIGKTMARLLKSDDSDSRSYTAGTPWELLYNADGGDIDWMYKNFQVIPYVIEVSGRAQGFQPSYAAWRDKTVQKLRMAWKYMLARVEGSGIRGRIVGESREGVDPATVVVRNAANQMLVSQEYRVGSSGYFHFVVAPGRYQVSAKVGGQTLSRHVVVGNEVQSIELNF